MSQDQVPVGHIPYGGHHVVPQTRHLPWQEHHRIGQTHDKQHVKSGEEPSGPPDPEVLEVYASPPLPLGQKQGGNEVTANDEEDLHAKEAARDEGEVGVVEEHGDDGQSAQPVQARTVRQTYFRGARRLGGTSVLPLAAVGGVGYLRLSQRTFRKFPPSECREMILAQSQEAMQGPAYEKLLHLVLFARISVLWGTSIIRRRSCLPFFGTWLISGASVKPSGLLQACSSTCNRACSRATSLVGWGRFSLSASVSLSLSAGRARTSPSRSAISFLPRPGPRSLTIRAISLRSLVARSAIFASWKAVGVRVYNEYPVPWCAVTLHALVS